MTACSSHPGTISGAALKELLDEAEHSSAILRVQVEAAAHPHRLSYTGFSLLTRIASGSANHNEQQLGELRQLGLVTEGERLADLLPAGARVLAYVNSKLGGWLEGLAIDRDPQQLRQLTESLRRITRSMT
jgi:hypothetical protein